MAYKQSFIPHLSVSLVPNLRKTTQSPKSDLTPWILTLIILIHVMGPITIKPGSLAYYARGALLFEVNASAAKVLQTYFFSFERQWTRFNLANFRKITIINVPHLL